MKTFVWEEVIIQVAEQVTLLEPLAKVWQEEETALATLDHLQTITQKRLKGKLIPRYLKQFKKEGWRVLSVQAEDHQLYILWSVKLKKRGWKITLNTSKEIMSIHEYELI